MNQFKNILVATDTRWEGHPIVNEAAEIAERNKATLTIVDVVPPLPWTVRLSLSNHQHIRDLVKKEKDEKLKALAAPLRDRGIQVETKVLQGKTAIEIIREVLRSGHDLVLGIAKGINSKKSGFFGNTAFRLLRICPCPVWLVAPQTTPRFKHVLGCVDTSSGSEDDDKANDQVYELASSISHYHQGRFSIVHAWQIYGENMIKSRMHEDDFANVAEATEKQVAALMEKFLERHGANLESGNASLLHGDPRLAIPKFIEENDVDLVVMGTVGRAGLSGVVMGNTAEQILSSIHCSVLALKPDDFQCPVTLSD